MDIRSNTKSANSDFIRNEIVKSARALHSAGMLAACDGNISYRFSDDNILITPKGRPKSEIMPDDLAIIRISGEVVFGSPSSEMLMHLAVYRRCPKAKAVAHAHPKVATAFSIAHPDLKELPGEHLSEIILAAGSVPIVPYARPGSASMGENLAPFLPHHRLFILARHGALCWGEDLQEATLGIERLEHTAQVLFYAQLMANNKHAILPPLPSDEVSVLKKMRLDIGEKIL